MSRNETQNDLFYTLDNQDAFGVDAEAVERLPMRPLLEQSVGRVMETARTMSAITIGCSYGKDSSCVLIVTLEAVRRLLVNEGIRIPVVVLTADTRVENPRVVKLAYTQSEAMLDWATAQGLDVTQQFVKPAAHFSYLVQLIGGKGVASVASSDSVCAKDLKIEPMNKAKKAIHKRYGRDNVVTLIGTRFDESTARGMRMRGRGERFDVAYRSKGGDWMLSPIADWSESDVWEVLNAADSRLGFDTFSDFIDTILLYEAAGESTCSIGAIDPAFSEKPASACSGGRMGCWMCMKVVRDHSMAAMVSQYEELEPLVVFADAVRAGHHVPSNRSYLGREVDADGRVPVFSNAYAPAWTEQLLRWILTIDRNEDEASSKRGVGRRFPRIMDAEQLLLIGFHWARYGLHPPGTFIGIMEEYGIVPAADGEIHYTNPHSPTELPTRTIIDDLWARNDKARLGRRYGTVQLLENWERGVLADSGYRDPLRSFLSADCAPAATDGLNADAADGSGTYTASSGTAHDEIGYSDEITVDLSAITDEHSLATAADFMWWWSMEFGDGRKSSNSELAWLFQVGLMRARRGYQSRLARYRVQAGAMQAFAARARVDDPLALMQHPSFVPADDGQPVTVDIEALIALA